MIDLEIYEQLDRLVAKCTSKVVIVFRPDVSDEDIDLPDMIATNIAEPALVRAMLGTTEPAAAEPDEE